MAEGVVATVSNGPDGLVLRLAVHDPDLAGKQAKFTVVQRFRCKVDSPVHKSRLLSEHEVRLGPGEQEIALGRVPADVFCYEGNKLDIELGGRLEIDDGVFFDTRLDVAITPVSTLPPRRKGAADAKEVHSPGDSFDFFANLRAIPSKARLLVIWMLILGGPLVMGNFALGVRDQFQPDSRVWFYDHSGSDGGESPFMKALAGSGAAGAALWLAIRRQLRRYMEFSAKLPEGRLRRGLSCRPGELISGKAGVVLEQVQVRLVAYNREHGQYTKQEKDGNSTKTVTKEFTSEAGGLVLYEQMLFHVPKDKPIESLLSGEISFDALFDTLYPPVMQGGTHGLDVQLEAQLLHPEFVDQEVELPVSAIEVRDFRNDGQAMAAGG
jgi:hypothetical protein